MPQFPQIQSRGQYQKLSQQHNLHSSSKIHHPAFLQSGGILNTVKQANKNHQYFAEKTRSKTYSSNMNNLMGLNNQNIYNNNNNSNNIAIQEEFGPILDANEDEAKKLNKFKKPQSFIRKGLKSPPLKDKFQAYKNSFQGVDILGVSSPSNIITTTHKKIKTSSNKLRPKAKQPIILSPIYKENDKTQLKLIQPVSKKNACPTNAPQQDIHYFDIIQRQYHQPSADIDTLQFQQLPGDLSPICNNKEKKRKKLDINKIRSNLQSQKNLAINQVIENQQKQQNRRNHISFNQNRLSFEINHGGIHSYTDNQQHLYNISPVAARVISKENSGQSSKTMRLNSFMPRQSLNNIHSFQTEYELQCASTLKSNKNHINNNPNFQNNQFYKGKKNSTTTYLVDYEMI